MTTEVLSPPDVPSKFSMYRAFTLKIMRVMSQQNVKYEMPWHSIETPLSVPANAASGDSFRSANILALWTEAAARGYTSQLWAGYAEWQSLGAQVRQGERGALVVFFQRAESTGGDCELDLLPRYSSRANWVFNACQVDNFVEPETPVRNRMEVHDDLELFIRAIDARIFRHPFKAHYDAALDNINMVDPTMFLGSANRSATESYYAVLLHELTRYAVFRIMPRRHGTGGDERAYEIFLSA